MSSVAVVIPVYNRNELLSRAMKGVLTQSSMPDEVIIVDDASDMEMTGSRAFAEKNGFQWWQLPQNSGVAAARNMGVEKTDSDWICFLDSDDEWLPGKVEAQMNWHRENPGCSISQVHEVWYRNGLPVRKPASWQQQGGDLFSRAVERCAISPSCVMLSRSLWERAGGFDEDLRVCEDYDLWLRITCGEQIALVGTEPMVRKHAGHGDQLSVETPAMDRFRVHALIKLLLSPALTPTQRKIAADGIRSKAGILEQGAAKRGVVAREAFYREIGQVAWESLTVRELERWLVQSSRHLSK